MAAGEELRLLWPFIEANKILVSLISTATTSLIRPFIRPVSRCRPQCFRLIVCDTDAAYSWDHRFGGTAVGHVLVFCLQNSRHRAFLRIPLACHSIWLFKDEDNKGLLEISNLINHLSTIRFNNL